MTSSTEYFRTDDTFSNRDNQENSMHQLDQPYSDAVEKVNAPLLRNHKETPKLLIADAQKARSIQRQEPDDQNSDGLYAKRDRQDNK